MTVGILALIIVAVLLMQTSVMALIGLYRRKRQYREMHVQVSKPQALSGSHELVPATLVKHEKPKTRPEGVSDQAITVTFSKTGTPVPWGLGAGSLLELAEAQGIDVESGCRAGSCGCCETALETGEVEYSQQPDADVEPGHCLLCISTPKGDITLAA